MPSSRYVVILIIMIIFVSTYDMLATHLMHFFKIINDDKISKELGLDERSLLCQSLEFQTLELHNFAMLEINLDQNDG